MHMYFIMYVCAILGKVELRRPELSRPLNDGASDDDVHTGVDADNDDDYEVGCDNDDHEEW